MSQSTNTSLDLTNTNQLSKVIEETNEILNNIPVSLSRLESVMKKPFKLIDKDNIQYIQKKAKVINEKIGYLSRRDSKATRTFMSLQMLTSGGNVYRVLRQILALIESKQQAVIENTYRIKKESIILDKLKVKLKETNDLHDQELIKLKIEQKMINVSNGMSYLEKAIAEIGFLMEEYEQICKNKNIPLDWTEEDFEKEEIKGHIRTAFRLGIRDIIVHGRLGMGTVEYFESFGIGYLEADFNIRMYLESCNEYINQVKDQITQDPNQYFDAIQNLPDYDNMHDFLDKMAETYQNNYKKVCKKLGLDEDIYRTQFILTRDKIKEIEGNVND